MMRKVLWTALNAVLTSVATALALRASVKIWQLVAREPPPTSKLAGVLVHTPIKKKILGALSPSL